MSNWKQCKFRFVAARGVEYRENWSQIWSRLMPEHLASMDATDLRRVADAMEKGSDDGD